MPYRVVLDLYEDTSREDAQMLADGLYQLEPGVAEARVEEVD